MPAPEGHAPYPGCETGGRPPRYDLDNEADELLEWSKQDDALRLYAFVDNKDYDYSKLSSFANRSEKFKKALAKAKDRIAYRREALVSQGLIAQCVYKFVSFFVGFF